MKKEFKLVFCFVLLLLVMVSSIHSIDEKIDKTIVKELKEKKEIEVIVEMKLDNQKIKTFSEKDLGNFPEEKINNKFENSFSTVVSEKELEELENNEKVLRVRESKKLILFLQDSVSIINASSSWSFQQNLTNITGLNETVCIIDTGVDYNHPDLGGCFGEGCKVIGGWDFCVGAFCSSEDDNPMDHNGHGTHVAGIVSAKGSVLGVSPDTKIIALKVFNDSGDGGNEVVLANAIQWCVDNSSIYDISVISMSLGFAEGDYINYCDSDYSGVASAINSAIAKNISVIAAAGNNGDYTAISSPACIENATSVAWASKEDIINSASNRNNITDLIAPGTDITSTWLDGGTATHQGTSMATPHVAGAFALIRQFKKLETGKILTPLEIQNALVNNGKIISDSFSGLNFSRIDIYSSILSLDETPPEIILNYPLDNLKTIDTNIIFSCNATDIQLKNITIDIYNSTGLYYENSTNINATSSYSEFNLSDINTGEYYYNCYACDMQENCGNYSESHSLEILEAVVGLISPENNTKTNTQNQSFFCNVTLNSNLNNITFFLWNSTDLIFNETKNITGLNNETEFNFSFSQETDYYWNCLAINNKTSEIYSDSNFTITYDKTKPNIALISPSDSYSETASSTTLDFQFNVSDNSEIISCELIIIGSSDSVDLNSSQINVTSTISKTLSAGNYIWNINCTDEAGNENNSSSRSIAISQPVASSGSGGGGGAITSINTYSVNKEEIKKGYSKIIGIGDKINFDLENEKHSITIAKIFASTVSVTLRSTPMNFDISIEEEKKFNLTNSDYYNLIIKLNSIKNNKANITIKNINEKIEKQETINPTNKENASVPLDYEVESDNSKKTKINLVGAVIGFVVKKRNLYIAYSLLLTIVICIIVNFWRKNEAKKRKSSETKLKRK